MRKVWAKHLSGWMRVVPVAGVSFDAPDRAPAITFLYTPWIQSRGALSSC